MYEEGNEITTKGELKDQGEGPWMQLKIHKESRSYGKRFS